MIDTHEVFNELNLGHEYIDNILSSIIALLNTYTTKHGKALVVRFDIRFPTMYPVPNDNVSIRLCMAKVVQKYKRYGLDPYYIWVREQNSGNHAHYHCLLLLNGNLVRSYSHVFDNVESLWGSTIGVNASGLIDHCSRSKYGSIHENGILLVRAATDFPSRISDVLRQTTYLAKTGGKCDYNDGLRNFGMSQIP